MFKEHLNAPSPVYDHFNTTGHTTTIDNFSIVGREDQNFARTIKESIYIKVKGPSLNKNIGKYHLAHIWGEVLFNTLELKIISPLAISSHSIYHLGKTSASITHHKWLNGCHSGCELSHTQLINN